MGHVKSPLLAGDRVGSYEVEQPIGVGGMAEVYRVHHVRTGTPCALKRPRDGTSASRERLLREGQAMARIQHPCVLRCLDVLETPQHLYLVLELVDGPDLATWLRQHTSRPAEVDHIGTQIIHGVAAAHRGGVIHRDLKPANVLLDAQGPLLQAKVADFGLARQPARTTLTRTGMMLGTPRYMAAEQWMDPRAATPQTDLFSLGCLLYELVHQRPAYDGDPRTVRRHVESGLRPAWRATWMPERIRRSVLWCLQRDPEARPPDTEALQRAWRGTLSPPPLPRAQRIVPWACGHRAVATSTFSAQPYR